MCNNRRRHLLGGLLLTPLAAALSAYARVTGADLVTVYINNPSAASASVSTDGWQVTVV